MDALVRFAARYLLVVAGIGLVILGTALRQPTIWGTGVLLAVAGDALRRRGGLGALATRWSRWRNPEPGPVPAYLAAPPDNLPPAVAGALIDARVDREEMVATLVDLAQRGILRVDPIGATGWHGPTDFALTCLDTTTPLSPFESRLRGALFPGQVRVGDQVWLSEVREPFLEARGTIVRLIEDELPRRGLAELPTHRDINELKDQVPIALAVSIGIWVGLGLLADLAPALWMSGIAVTVTGVLAWAVMRLLPQLTPDGTEAIRK